MYLLLLGFGVGLSAAGILLAGAGLSIREGSFDSGLFTPGIVAAVGGFLLIGLGLALRTLHRIQRQPRSARLVLVRSFVGQPCWRPCQGLARYSAGVRSPAAPPLLARVPTECCVSVAELLATLNRMPASSAAQPACWARVCRKLE